MRGLACADSGGEWSCGLSACFAFFVCPFRFCSRFLVFSFRVLCCFLRAFLSFACGLRRFRVLVRFRVVSRRFSFRVGFAFSFAVRLCVGVRALAFASRRSVGCLFGLWAAPALLLLPSSPFFVPARASLSLPCLVPPSSLPLPLPSLLSASASPTAFQQKASELAMLHCCDFSGVDCPFFVVSDALVGFTPCFPGGLQGHAIVSTLACSVAFH